MSKARDYAQLIALYQARTGKTDFEMHDVAKFGEANGFKMPEPKSPIDELAKQLSKAARETTRPDATGVHYRAYHNVILHAPNGKTQVSWFDIDQSPPRHRMKQALNQRREQMVGDAVQLTIDADHWNKSNSTQEAIQMELDFNPDVEWRRNAPKEEEKDAS